LGGAWPDSPWIRHCYLAPVAVDVSVDPLAAAINAVPEFFLLLAAAAGKFFG